LYKTHFMERISTFGNVKIIQDRFSVLRSNLKEVLKGVLVLGATNNTILSFELYNVEKMKTALLSERLFIEIQNTTVHIVYIRNPKTKGKDFGTGQSNVTKLYAVTVELYSISLQCKTNIFVLIYRLVLHFFLLFWITSDGKCPITSNILRW
jgi:hypothetical protein